MHVSPTPTHGPVARAIVGSLLQSLSPHLPRAVLDDLAVAIDAHLLQRYGDPQPGDTPATGGLSGERERRAKELLASRLEGDISVAEVASECGLSRSHFTRAFRESTGTTPHKWLQQHRVEKAKQMLRFTELPIAEIAAACGFADQSHLTRAFTRLVRVAPGAWRRQ